MQNSGITLNCPCPLKMVSFLVGSFTPPYMILGLQISGRIKIFQNVLFANIIKCNSDTEKSFMIINSNLQSRFCISFQKLTKQITEALNLLIDRIVWINCKYTRLFHELIFRSWKLDINDIIRLVFLPFISRGPMPPILVCSHVADLRQPCMQSMFLTGHVTE